MQTSPFNRSGRLRAAVSAVLGATTYIVCATAGAQDSATAPQKQGPIEEVVVTGFRESLNAALEQKRASIEAVDAIIAEDIAKFPELNLAESVQRVPGVSISRDGGEGRQISVRGLGPQFTRVRINGMEAMSANGGTDAAGGTNRDRSFDFNTFASELFNSITVRKTAAAEIEEGSLGATVDLRSAHPFDYDGLTAAASLQGAYNDLRDKANPRGAFLISNTFGEGQFGALMSVAYTRRKVLDEGASTVRWQNALNTDGTVSAGNAFGPLDPSYPTASAPTLAQLNAAFRPRIPRYDIYNHDQERLGVTGSLQWKPTDRTVLTLDGMYAKFDAKREEIFLEAPVFSSTGGSAINNVNPRNASIDGSNTLVYGVFDDVDIRSEARFDKLKTQFTHITLDGTHEFSDTVRAHGLIGYSEANHDNPIQTTLLFDRADVDGYSFDFRDNSRLPLITYGNADVTSPATWTLSQIRLRPQSSFNSFKTASFEVTWDTTDAITLKAGPQYKKFAFDTTSKQRSNGTTSNRESVIPANVASTPIANYSRLVSMNGSLNVPSGTPTRWLIPDLQRAAEQFALYDTSVFPVGIETALGNNYQVNEEDVGGFIQAEFKTEVVGLPLRGNVGVRYVDTRQESSGYTFSSGVPLLTTVKRTYNNTLPSLNLVLEVDPKFLVRASAAKVMTRPNGGGQTTGLGILAPGAAVQVSGSNKTVTAGNPLLKPYKANAYDLSFEWYPTNGALVSLAAFYKDIDSFVQIVRSTDTFSNNALGLPDSVAFAACGNTAPTCLDGWQFSQPRNTKGGNLKGYEINYQQPLSFLPGFWSHFGLLLNYTGVKSQIEYLSATGAVAAHEDLTGLSKSAYNATLYWENKVFSARASAAYRGKYLTTVPGRNGNDVEGTASTMNVDASASWTINNNLVISLEGLNLTDEYQDQWVDSAGDRLSYYHHQGREYLLGARYKF